MRIVGGEFSSRRLKTLEGTNTRPTLDKVREAVFSSLGGRFDGGKVLDLYAGSGAIGLEAMSRGIDTAVFVEKNRAAAGIVKENIAALHVENRSRVMVVADTTALNVLCGEGVKFDLVYLDPPYRMQKNEMILERLCKGSLLNEGASVVIEALKEDPLPALPEGLEFRKDAVYGITRIIYLIYRGI